MRIKVQAWEHHLQPLLCDIGLILENLTQVTATMANQQPKRCNRQQQQLQQLRQQHAQDWLDLVARVSSFCIENGFTAWTSLLVHLVEATVGLSAATEASALKDKGVSSAPLLSLQLRSAKDAGAKKCCARASTHLFIGSWWALSLPNRLRSTSGLTLALATLAVAACSTRFATSSIGQASILILSAAWAVWGAYSWSVRSAPIQLNSAAAAPTPAPHNLWPPGGLQTQQSVSQNPSLCAPQPFTPSPTPSFSTCASGLLVCANTQASHRMAEISLRLRQHRSKSSPPLLEPMDIMDARTDSDARRRCVSDCNAELFRVRGQGSPVYKTNGFGMDSKHS
eukprot:scaffold55208_cov17-Tisochrysis_lutea.AAC.2